MRRFLSRLRKLRARCIHDERGQAATEYMMVISVMVVAVVFGTKPFYDPQGPYLKAFRQFERNVATILADDNSELLPGLNPGP